MQRQPIDQMSGAGIIVPWDHHKIHVGGLFTAHYEGATAGVGEEIAMGFQTPAAAAGRVHMIIDVRGDDEAVWEFREDPTVVLNQGTRLAVLNRNRPLYLTHTSGMLDLETNAANGVSTFNVAEAAAANLAGGGILHSETIAIAGDPPFASVVNAQSRGQREWILRASTEYVAIVTSSVVGAGNYEISLNWYEHTDSNYANP